jgi:hypothetical protein
MFHRKLYYRVKPFVPWSCRIALRRLHARRIRKDSTSIWPIDPAAGAPPAGWGGWPDGKRFALVLTHDVEGQRGLERCQELMDLNQRLGFRSCFNFVPEGGYATPKKLRDSLTSNGFEVGVHDLRHDGKLFFSRTGFQAQARKIKEYLKEWGAVGFRSGFMQHNLEWLHEVGAYYDASTFDTDPFEFQPDGVKTIFPFWVPTPRSRANHEKMGEGGYIELPYTLPQDSTLFVLFREKSTEIWQRKLDWLVENGGMALLIAHPDYMRFAPGPCSPREYPAAFYEEFLRYVRSRYAGQYWLALPREVAEYARQMHVGGSLTQGPREQTAVRSPALA